jgi:hypothetical protein
MGGHVRNFGIYKLPDGTEIVAKRQINGELEFYTRDNYEKDGQAEYQLDEDYNLLKNGKPTGWHRRNMKWTGLDAW